MSVSASVVSIRYCGANQDAVLMSPFESSDCCCADGDNMVIKHEQKRSGLVLMHMEDANLSIATPVKTCCSELVLQSRTVANQLISSEASFTASQTPQALPALRSVFQLYLQPCLSHLLHRPVAADLKAPPPGTPLYKLFQRFTYYG